MDKILIANDYKNWFLALKQKIRHCQIKASVKVHSELLRMYWELGQDIVNLQMDSKWGNRFFEQLSRDLKNEFPQSSGFSISNLKYMKRFYLFYSDDIIRHQVGDEFELVIFRIPWRHHVELMTKCKNANEALFYINETLENGWSRAVLINMLELDLYNTKGNAVTNFTKMLPKETSDLAKQILKDPYSFDFLSMRANYDERELEEALVENITKFLLELGSGFAFVGRQVRLEVGGKEFFIDLLFYHLKLRSYVVVELKVVEFEPSYLGQLGFYVTAIDEQMKQSHDNETIGLLICKSKNKIVAEYALKNAQQPLGISEYQLSKVIPDEFKSSLPTIEEIESELN